MISRLFIIVGVVFLIIGVYYALSSMGAGSGGLYRLLMSLFQPSDEAKGKLIQLSGHAYLILVLYFLPAAIALVVINLYSTKFGRFTYPASIFVALYLLVIQTWILMLNIYSEVCYYQNFFIFAVFLFSIILLLFITAYNQRKSTILIISCFYFYISLVLLIANFGGPFDYLFPFVLLFSSFIVWIGRKIERPYINLINFAFAIGFFDLFWLRKFVVNSKADYLIEFFVFGILFYLLFYAIVVYTSNNRKRQLSKWMQLVIIWSNLLFFIGTTSFVLIKYYSFGYLWIFVLALLLFNLLVLNILKRINAISWSLPHHFIIIFLGALILPLLLHQNMVLLFTAGLSIFMLVYANEYKNSPSMWISLVAMILMIGRFLFSLGANYVPAFFAETTLPDVALMWNGIISGVVMVVSLSISQWLLDKVEISISKKWFKRSKYNLIIRALLLFLIFFTMGWIGFSLLYQITGTVVFSSVGWFITGSIFFIIIINFYSGNKSTFKRPLLYIAFTYALSYTLLVYWNMTIYREKLIHIGNLNVTAFLLHYIALILLVVLGIMTFSRIYLRNAKNNLVQREIQIFMIVFSFFLLCTEYDNITVLIATIQNYSNGMFGFKSEMLTFNQHLPYSIIMWLFTVILFFWAISRHKHFLRNFSVLLFVAILIKVFAYDFEILNPGVRSAVFIIAGLFFLSFAILYPRLLKAESKYVDSKRIAKESQKAIFEKDASQDKVE